MTEKQKATSARVEENTAGRDLPSFSISGWLGAASREATSVEDGRFSLSGRDIGYRESSGDARAGVGSEKLGSDPDCRGGRRGEGRYEGGWFGPNSSSESFGPSMVILYSRSMATTARIV